MKNNPDFNLIEFFVKVEKAFVEIQEAWGKGNIKSVRRFISDGVYQRFNTQLKMMSLLKQRDIISNISVSEIHLDKCGTDGLYDILHVGILAGMDDQFVCQTMPELNSPGGYEEFIEYWSFIKKRGSSKNDLYSTNECPCCSAPLSQAMGDSGKCPYCDTFVNSGEYDWVLSEITQKDDYVDSEKAFNKAPGLSEKVKKLIEENKDFAVQEIEDKASNGYLQILTAITLKDPAIMRRFVTDNAFAKLSKRIKKATICYNRLYLNAVSLIGIKQDDAKNILFVEVRSTYQRVQLVSEDEALLVDPELTAKQEVIVMKRRIQTQSSKGSLYAHICSTCGAPVKDSLDIKCPYCSTPLNSSKNEWIISDILGMDEYENHFS